jgi:hypothetical protein
MCMQLEPNKESKSMYIANIRGKFSLSGKGKPLFYFYMPDAFFLLFLKCFLLKKTYILKKFNNTYY